MTEQDLVLITGFDEATVHGVLERLHELGAVSWSDEPAGMGRARERLGERRPVVIPNPSRVQPRPVIPPFMPQREGPLQTNPITQRALEQAATPTTDESRGAVAPPNRPTVALPTSPRTSTPASSLSATHAQPPIPPQGSSGSQPQPQPPIPLQGSSGSQPQPPLRPSAPTFSPTYDPAELESRSDLDMATRKGILDLFYSLNRLTHYDLLGVPLTAERKEIRRSYHAHAPSFHPDRFFGKNLGAFKPKMEAVFGRLTVAYETLADAERRAEYDAYLATQRATATMESLLSTPLDSSQSTTALASRPASPSKPPDPASVALAMAARSTPRPAPNQTEGSQSGPPPALPTPSFAPRTAQLTSSIPPRTPEEERARREALARKLSGGRTTLPPTARATPSLPPVSKRDSQAAIQDLRRRRDAAMADPHRVRKHLDTAKQLASNGDAAGAANAYRLALTLDPENQEIARAHEDAARTASHQLAQAYVRQGDYEARHGSWAQAARSFSRAAAGLPDDPDIQERTARAICRAGGDLHRAMEYAQRAVALVPKRIEARLVLAEIHLAAGRPLLAKRELDAAREVAPQDDRIKEFSKKFR